MASFQEAFAGARELRLVDRAVEAAVGFERAVGLPGLPGEPVIEMVSDALALLGDEAGPRRIRLLASLSSALGLAGRHDEAHDASGRKRSPPPVSTVMSTG